MSTILIVDDSATMRTLVRQALEPDGHIVIEAPNGAAALAALERSPADLVITDVIMPEMDGLGFTRRLRANEAIRHIPVLILTTEATPAMKERGRIAGATGWLVKPFHPDTLRQSVRRVLADRAA
jgi:two-component system chemotaxis response regulator CheY